MLLATVSENVSAILLPQEGQHSIKTWWGLTIRYTPVVVTYPDSAALSKSTDILKSYGAKGLNVQRHSEEPDFFVTDDPLGLAASRWLPIKPVPPHFDDWAIVEAADDVS